MDGKLKETKRKHGMGTRNDIVDEAKVPKLRINYFLGSMVEFQSFWACFIAMVDSKSSYSDVIKLSYPKSYLGAATFRAVQGLLLTSST